jgi:HPt (histidine-containing phosphotransfer) domain-containing protein
VKGGIRRVAGNRKLYLDLLRRYVEGQQDSAERIRTALKNGDKDLAERIAHTVKGVSGNIGAADAQTAAGDLEASLHKDEAEGRIQEVLSQFSLAIGTAITKIRAALGSPSESRRITTDGKKLDPSALREILQKLTLYAEESDSEAFEYLDSVREELSSSFPRKDFDELEEAMKAYDFPAALVTLRRLSTRPPGSM